MQWSSCSSKRIQKQVIVSLLFCFVQFSFDVFFFAISLMGERRSRNEALAQKGKPEKKSEKNNNNDDDDNVNVNGRRK